MRYFYLLLALGVLACDTPTTDKNSEDGYKARTADKIYKLSCGQRCLYENEKKHDLDKLNACMQACGQ